MSPIQPVQAAVTQLQNCFSDLSRLTVARPADWRRRYVDLRREANAVLASLSSAIAFCPEAEADVKPAFIRLRHGIILHQAEWPVVAIDFDAASYKASMRDLVTTMETLTMATRILNLATRSAA